MIAIVDFGMGNIHSCMKAISLYTDTHKLVSDPKELENVKGIVLPGDGAFQKAMENLQSSGMAPAIQKKVEEGVPLFGICIGFQLLFRSSDESKEKNGVIPGFGFLQGEIRRFRGKNYKIPHMGWNRLHIEKKKNKILSRIESGAYMYFIHSYRPVNVNNSAVLAYCNYYGEKFPVVVESGNIFGTQFHPEKSDREGLRILENFIRLAV